MARWGDVGISGVVMARLAPGFWNGVAIDEPATFTPTVSGMLQDFVEINGLAVLLIQSLDAMSVCVSYGHQKNIGVIPLQHGFNRDKGAPSSGSFQPGLHQSVGSPRLCSAVVVAAAVP
jgi:hypothetical protein